MLPPCCRLGPGQMEPQLFPGSCGRLEGVTHPQLVAPGRLHPHPTLTPRGFEGFISQF